MRCYREYRVPPSLFLFHPHSSLIQRHIGLCFWNDVDMLVQFSPTLLPTLPTHLPLVPVLKFLKAVHQTHLSICYW
jgi:hypothetical protein